MMMMAQPHDDTEKEEKVFGWSSSEKTSLSSRTSRVNIQGEKLILPDGPQSWTRTKKENHKLHRSISKYLTMLISD